MYLFSPGPTIFPLSIPPINGTNRPPYFFRKNSKSVLSISLDRTYVQTTSRFNIFSLYNIFLSLSTFLHEIKRCLFLGRKVMTNLDSIFGEGNGNPLQCSCLENPRDRGAWWAAVCGVAQSRTRLKRLSCSSSSSCLMEYYFEFLKKNFVQIILYYRLSLFWGFSHFLKGRNMLTSIQFMNAFLIRCFWLLHGIS